MRELKENERFVKDYGKFILIEVACPLGRKYRTTIDKWTSKDVAKVERKNSSTYKYLGFKVGGMYD